MQDITKEQLSKLKENEFSILFFYAKNCKFCELMKPIFEQYTQNYPNIGFYSSELNENLDYFLKYAEETQEVIYEEKPTVDGGTGMEPVYQVHSDGSPKMIKKIVAPSFYVHHTQASSEDNELGFIGGFDGMSEIEIKQVCESISSVV